MEYTTSLAYYSEERYVEWCGIQKYHLTMVCNGEFVREMIGQGDISSGFQVVRDW
jgi:hypothetical protein